MSRLHPPFNTNNELLTNCENYLTKMLRTRRVERPKNVRERPAGCCSNQPAPLRIQSAKPPGGPVSKAEEVRRAPSAEELIHKEIFNNNMATVEVTVRTMSQKGAKEAKGGDEKREPWNKLLMTHRSEENVAGSFVNFDPLRTLHFLSKELQLKLHALCPGDPNVQQILHDMQNAIQRLPPDVVSRIKSGETISSKATCRENSESRVSSKKADFQGAKKEERNTKCTQTIIIGDVEAKKIQQQLEDSANKLESTCKEMENACTKLREERDQLVSKLMKEKESVKALKKELNECMSEKDSRLNEDIHRLIAERDSLKTQAKDLQAQMESQSGQSVVDLRTVIQGLRNKQLTTEQENMTIRNELTIMKLERDKMNVLLDCRDKQLRELRNELECIQQLVASQLLELKTKPPLSPASSLSSLSQLWNIPSTKVQNKPGKSIHELYINAETDKMVPSKDMQSVVFSGTDSTLVDEEQKENSFKIEDEDDDSQQDTLHHNTSRTELQTQTMSNDMLAFEEDFLTKNTRSSIKDMFAEIKRQAFLKMDVSLPSPPRPFNEVRPTNTPTSTST